MTGNRYDPLTSRGNSSLRGGKRTSSRRTPSHPPRSNRPSRRTNPPNHYTSTIHASTSSTAIPTPVSSTPPVNIPSSISSGNINKMSLPSSQPLLPTRAPRRRRPLQMVYIDHVSACLNAVNRLSHHQKIALDCEGVALSRTGKLCLLQMASPDCIYLFDLISAETPAEQLMNQGGLKGLLERSDVYKVTHDCRHDSDALFHQFNVKLGPVIDTQVVFAVLRRVRGMPACLPVSLRTLLKKFAGASESELIMKNEIKGNMTEDEGFWLKRPLSQQAIKYARMDVEYLLQVTQLLARYIDAADKTAWKDVLEESQKYLKVFRDDSHGPRKAQQQYEQMARVARRQRIAFEQQKRVQSHRENDPMKKFSFNVERVVQSIKT